MCSIVIKSFAIAVLVCAQVPTILEANTYSLKLLHKRIVVLERLNQAPVDASSGESYGTVAAAPLCSRSANGSVLDF